jgi:late competence protein required for DNA uptake (superfamily II DNA/RNA helicase)
MRSKVAKEVSGNNLDRRTVAKYAKRHELPTPKYMRKVSWKPMIKAVCLEKWLDLFRVGLES